MSFNGDLHIGYGVIVPEDTYRQLKRHWTDRVYADFFNKDRDIVGTEDMYEGEGIISFAQAVADRWLALNRGIYDDDAGFVHPDCIDLDAYFWRIGEKDGRRILWLHEPDSSFSVLRGRLVTRDAIFPLFPNHRENSAGIQMIEHDTGFIATMDRLARIGVDRALVIELLTPIIPDFTSFSRCKP